MHVAPVETEALTSNTRLVIHRIIELLKVEKTLKIESNHDLTVLPVQSCFWKCDRAKRSSSFLKPRKGLSWG